MPSYAHKKLIEQIARLDSLPTDKVTFLNWIQAGQHLDLLLTNSKADEIIGYASGPYTFIHSIVVPTNLVTPENRGELLAWSCNPYRSIASYVYGGTCDEVWIERGGHSRGSDVLNAGTDLVFGRTFEGWSGRGQTYFELNQEFTHLTGIHFRPEHGAYCRYDSNGDLEHTVSITPHDHTDQEVSLVSFSWSLLEQYLAISNTALVRMFDFTLLDRSNFHGWPTGPETIVELSEEFFYRQKVAGSSAYTRGVQIIHPRRSPADIMSDFKSGGKESKRYVEFIARDWRNKIIAKISTDPQATTNYFDANQNELPFEPSPAFFRSEVLSKYKTDREKYTVGERDIHCRAAWYLRGYDVNEAGQIHVYICDLRQLPYAEQLHWLSYNEAPKTGISERAFTNDFQGEFTTFTSPREKVLSLLRRWDAQPFPWWRLRDGELLKRANPPLTTSKDEWSEAMMDLSKLVVEGFETKELRRSLDHLTVSYAANDQSIALLERLITRSNPSTTPTRLDGLRIVQLIRSKVRGHAGSTEARLISERAISEHGSFAGHFDYVAELVAAELEMIERSYQSFSE